MSTPKLTPKERLIRRRWRAVKAIVEVLLPLSPERRRRVLAAAEIISAPIPSERP